MATPYRLRQLELRREAILNAAHQLLGRLGYEEMTMDVVAAEVGIRQGEPLQHFPSKEKLAARTMTRLFDRTIARLHELDRRCARATNCARCLTGCCASA